VIETEVTTTQQIVAQNTTITTTSSPPPLRIPTPTLTPNQEIEIQSTKKIKLEQDVSIGFGEQSMGQDSSMGDAKDSSGKVRNLLIRWIIFWSNNN
jgi:hypothetical protein